MNPRPRMNRPSLDGGPFDLPLDGWEVAALRENARATGVPPDWRIIGIGLHDGGNALNFR